MSQALFGWIPPEERSKELQEYHEQVVAEMPEFKIVGSNTTDDKRVVIWDCSKAANGGKHFTVFRQETGSCVGNGLGQAVWYLSAVEVIRLQDREQVILPFYLLPYGRSRMYAGMRGKGEGSLGSAAAKAIKTDGILPATTEGLPKWNEKDGISWGQRVEYDWSDGNAIDQKWLDLSRKHLVKTVSQCPTADAARDAIRNYYPLTLASNWGGNMQCRAAGNPAVLLNERTGQWMHQMSCMGWQEHPELGELFYILNSWGPRTHGQPPDDAPPGGFWIRKNDMEYICRQNEVFALSQFDGFPSQRLPKELFDIVGD